MNLQTIADALEFSPATSVANLTMYPLLHGDETRPATPRSTKRWRPAS